MAAQQDNPYLTITLSGRTPIKIKKEDWPCIAEAMDEQWEGEYESQSNRSSSWFLRVRKHADGRIVVYARYSYDTRWVSERNKLVRGGVLRPDATDIEGAIKEVAAWMAAQTGDTEQWQKMENDCLADMPAEELA